MAFNASRAGSEPTAKSREKINEKRQRKRQKKSISTLVGVCAYDALCFEDKVLCAQIWTILTLFKFRLFVFFCLGFYLSWRVAKLQRKKTENQTPTGKKETDTSKTKQTIQSICFLSGNAWRGENKWFTKDFNDFSEKCRFWQIIVNKKNRKERRDESRSLTHTHKVEKENHFRKHVSLVFAKAKFIQIQNEHEMNTVLCQSLTTNHCVFNWLCIDCQWLAEMDAIRWTEGKWAGKNIHTVRIGEKVAHLIISPLEKQIKPKPREKSREGRWQPKKWFMQIGIINM